jgi:hypothetical protein
MSLQTNPQLELAFEYVRNTDKSVFLTGKAGSGKTTFLHQIKADGTKRMAVVAPTGVAAINAGGMTIHSLFQLPFGIHLPGVERHEKNHERRFSRRKALADTQPRSGVGCRDSAVLRGHTGSIRGAGEIPLWRKKYSYGELSMVIRYVQNQKAPSR